jgi:recombination protein RecA
VKKNKVAPPFKQAEFDIMYNEGISREGDILELGVEEDLVKKSGSWFSYKDEKLGQGRENSKQFLRENPTILDEIETIIREKHNLTIEAKSEVE